MFAGVAEDRKYIDQARGDGWGGRGGVVYRVKERKKNVSESELDV